jgi:hypothetical protein
MCNCVRAMRQVAQTPHDGSLSVVDVPEPVVAPGRLLVAAQSLRVGSAVVPGELLAG